MEGRPFFRRKDREALRERWLQRAGQAFERMFAQANQDQLVTMTQREDRACLLGKELAAFLWEEHTAADHQARPSDKQPAHCPKGHQPGVRVTGADEELPERELTTRAGEIKFRREQWRCQKCRIVFFPLDQKLKLGWPIDWTFYDREGKGFRSEKDTNGDGIPDTVNDRPLAVQDSWAIHPELIPKECTLPELGGRRVPVRRIPFDGTMLGPAPKGSMSAVPASLALLGLAYLGLIGYCWRRRKRPAA
jgi:hypothetical protein